MNREKEYQALSINTNVFFGSNVSAKRNSRQASNFVLRTKVRCQSEIFISGETDFGICIHRVETLPYAGKNVDSPTAK